MMMFMGLAAINSQANLLFGVFGLMIGILLISGVVCRLVLSHIDVKRVLPDHAVVGAPAILSYEFTNHKRFWPSLSVCVSELDGSEAFFRQPQAYMLHVAPGMTASVPVELRPKRRGLHTLDKFQISTSFPFGFIKRAVDREHRETLMIYPALAEVNPRLIAMARSADKSGATTRPRKGGEDEFYGVKEFRPGENPRWIYWRRSARTPGVMVAKEMTQVSPPRLLVLVDSYVGKRAPAEHAAVERAIAMAASTISVALEAGLSVGLCAWDNGWVAIPGQRGKRHRRDLLSQVARLPLNTVAPAASLLDHSHGLMKSGTTPMLFTPRDLQQGKSETRAGMIIISSVGPQADRWFQFDSGVDFSRCMPPDQQPAGSAGA